MTDDTEVEAILAKAHNWFVNNRRKGEDGVKERLEKMKKMIPLMEERGEELAQFMTLEMGKPITQSRGEVKKCIGHVKYYIEHGVEFV